MLFKNKNILILGDLILDQYFFGDVEKLSPEAPVPIVCHQESKYTLGGAANTARNIASLGGKPTLIGVIGDDADGHVFKDLLDTHHISHHLFHNDCPTIKKIRIVSRKQQLLRLDIEQKIVLSEDLINEILIQVKNMLTHFDLVVISDYAKGMVHPLLCQAIIKLCRSQDKMTVIDPKNTDWNIYKGCSVLTPNFKELSEHIGTLIPHTDDHVTQYAQSLPKTFDISAMIVTRSEQGMSLIDSKHVTHFPVVSKDVIDVSGAGDTVVAVLALCLANQLSFSEAIKMANQAASIVVSKFGTSSVTYDELFGSESETLIAIHSKASLINEPLSHLTKIDVLSLDIHQFDIHFLSNIQTYSQDKPSFILVLTYDSAQLTDTFTIQHLEHACSIFNHFERLAHLILVKKPLAADVLNQFSSSKIKSL